MVLTELKAQTRSYHDQLEGNLYIAGRLSSPELYQALLGRFLGFYDPVEKRIAGLPGWASLSLDFGRRRKAALLRKDLKALGMSDDDIGLLPVCAEAPALSDMPQALGCMYVLEGATLGGQLISRQLKGELGVDESNGGAFFNSYGAGTSRMWKEFSAFLSAYSTTDSIENAIIESARDTFIAFDRWLSAEETAR